MTINCYKFEYAIKIYLFDFTSFRWDLLFNHSTFPGSCCIPVSMHLDLLSISFQSFEFFIAISCKLNFVLAKLFQKFLFGFPKSLVKSFHWNIFTSAGCFFNFNERNYWIFPRSTSNSNFHINLRAGIQIILNYLLNQIHFQKFILQLNSADTF